MRSIYYIILKNYQVLIYIIKHLATSNTTFKCEYKYLLKE